VKSWSLAAGFKEDEMSFSAGRYTLLRLQESTVIGETCGWRGRGVRTRDSTSRPSLWPVATKEQLEQIAQSFEDAWFGMMHGELVAREKAPLALYLSLSLSLSLRNQIPSTFEPTLLAVDS
jgi:hypothetical protein